MLTSCKLTGSAATIAAYHSSDENYYFSQAGGVESIGGGTISGGGPRIHGGLASALGFKDGSAIAERDLANLLSSRDAAGKLVAREHKVIGIDLTFSAPKSVSVAGLLTDRDPAIILAHDRAVLETMREVERFTAGTQLFRNGDVSSVKTGNMAYVTVRDGFNREHEPHLHTHVVVMNLTAYEDKIMALDGRQIMRQDFNKVWGAMYRAKLAAYLKEAGHSVSYTKKGELRMDSVSLAVEREFSSRRAEIVAAKEGGDRDMAAWRKTRKAKNPEAGKADILADWRARLERHQAKTAAQNRAEAAAEREAWTREAQFSIEARQELAGERGGTEAARWQAAARRATERSAAATANVLITEYLTELARGEGWEPITYSAAEQRLMAEVRAGRLLATDDGRYTTWEMTRADRECVRERQAPAWLALSPNEAKSLVEKHIQKSKGAGLRAMSDQQVKAAAGVLSDERATVVVQGDAGAGKTTMLRAVSDIAKAKGWETVGLAVQGIAARNLQDESGIKSSTLSAYLAREKGGPGAVRLPRAARLIVIDEASMIDSRGLAELMRLADKSRDKIVLVGDRNQIQSVGAGRPFDRLVEAAAESGRLLSLCENYRQRDKDLREAVGRARDGHMRESLDILARTNRVTEIEDKAVRRAIVASHYDKDTLIVTGSRESRDALNLMIRDSLAQRGMLDLASARTYELTWRDADGMNHSIRRELAAGDVVTFLKNDYREDFDVRNGERGEILKTSAGGVTVRLESGRTVDVDMESYAALDYGYALTTYKSQGQTYDKVVVDADTSVAALQDQRNTYVQITRARDDIRVFTDDKAELRELAGVLSYKSDTFGVDATLEKAAAMERQVRAEAFGERARHEAGAKIRQAESWAAETAEKIQQTMEGGIRQNTARDQADIFAANAARELQEARSAEKTAEDSVRAMRESHNDAKVSWYKAEARLEKARFWEKPAAEVAEKDARQGLEAAHQKSMEADTAFRAAHEKLENARALSREAQARSIEAARRENFRGSPQAVAEVVKTDSANQEARRELETARAAEQEARRASDAERHRYNEAWQEDAAKERLAEIRAAQERAISRAAEAREMVASAEAKQAATQKLAAEAAQRNDLEATREALGARTDFTPAERQRVAEYLSRDGAEILLGCDNPEQAIAAGSVACGLRNIDDAAKGMEKSVADKIADSVERQRQAGLSRTRQHSHGFGLSLE